MAHSSEASWETVYQDEVSADIDIVPGKTLDGHYGIFYILKFIDSGYYGKVVKAKNVITRQSVALKIINNEEEDVIANEIEILQTLRTLDADESNIVNFYEWFEHCGHTCLVFEMLDKSLYDLLNENGMPFSLHEIRPITHQLLSAFDALGDIGIIYNDLKLENVMLVNQRDQPFRVKLIDFGLSIKTSEVDDGLGMPIVPYRAPELFLGLPFSEAIDMWALGCILFQMFLFDYPFGNDFSKIGTMENIVAIMGQPADHLLNAGKFTTDYFVKNPSSEHPKWLVKNQTKTGLEPKPALSVNSLEDLVTLNPVNHGSIEIEDRRAFVSLLKGLLNTDPEKRISPKQALSHPFITMVHLQENAGSQYLEDARDKMVMTYRNRSEENHLSPASVVDKQIELAEADDIESGDILNGDLGQYCVSMFLSKGAFGKVVKAKNVITGQSVALKIINNEQEDVIANEIEILQTLRTLDADESNIVQFFEWFEHYGHTCLVFEMLDQSLFNQLRKNGGPFSLCEIRPITQQLLSAFDALGDIGIIYNDLKLDNVMLVNQRDQPFRVKLIDFGLSVKTSEADDGFGIPTVPFRAPELFLGNPSSEAIDMWALGCLLFQMFLCENPFGNDFSEIGTMENIVAIMGQPADHLLNAGKFTTDYFVKNPSSEHPKWLVKNQTKTGLEPKPELSVNSLEDLVTLYPWNHGSIEIEDRRAFVSLLKGLLNTDPEKRISPKQALSHPFITMVHLQENAGSQYLEDARDKMVITYRNRSEENHLSPAAVVDKQEEPAEAEAAISRSAVEDPALTNINQSEEDVLNTSELVRFDSDPQLVIGPSQVFIFGGFLLFVSHFAIPSQYTSAHVITPINTSPSLQVHSPGWL
ncbi:hypothetical protein KUCAC02_028913 [Xyrichtys novacula]|uniref:Protein kinase domain-containing protein n=1 Tax=Xyrichtys novacula TaxID=13765 RepID=A0AAV1HQ44_XYRNO|nr:hypothetical protein KUCAC02_028913 [Xyrichtys novacula]